MALQGSVKYPFTKPQGAIPADVIILANWLQSDSQTRLNLEEVCSYKNTLTEMYMGNFSSHDLCLESLCL